MTRRPPRSTPFPTRRSSDLLAKAGWSVQGWPRRAPSTFRNLFVQRYRSEEHTSELQSRLHLLFPLFFFNDPAPTQIYTFPYTTLFRSPSKSRLVGSGMAEEGAKYLPKFVCSAI